MKLNKIRSTAAVIAALMIAACFASCGDENVNEMSADSSSAPTVTATEVPTEAETAAPTEATPDKDGLYAERLTRFEVTSENLHDGRWDEVISNTSKGSNESPQLAWEPVDGAGCYAVIMVDLDANNYLHWLSGGVTDTVLPQGWAPEAEYTGPWPPDGTTHEYEVFVIALKETPEKMPVTFSSTNEKIYEKLDTSAAGENGNIISYGTITGLYIKE